MLKFSNNLINSNKEKADETKEKSVNPPPLEDADKMVTNGHLTEQNNTVNPAFEGSRVTFTGNTSDNRLTFSGPSSATKMKTPPSPPVIKPQKTTPSAVVKSTLPKAAANDEIFAQYAKFKEKKLRLAGYLKDASSMLEELNMDAFTDKLKKLSEKVSSDSFKVQIVGTFKNGKCTFIS